MHTAVDSARRDSFESNVLILRVICVLVLEVIASQMLEDYHDNTAALNVPQQCFILLAAGQVVCADSQSLDYGFYSVRETVHALFGKSVTLQAMVRLPSA